MIEEINILQASLGVMRQAVEYVEEEADYDKLMVLVDGNFQIPGLKFSQKYVIKGDSRSASIAAASILAKVERDRYMLKLDKEYPQYGWAKNMGYLTKDHLAAIDKYGPKGKTLLSFLIKLIIDKGRAINEAINIVTIDISNPSVNPIKNINFISPPPRLSFLNIKSPNTLNK